jgi:hypothetical protein
MRTVFVLGVLALSVATLQSAFAAGPSGRFVEFHSPGGWTDIYDIETVRMILPGRFTVIKTTIDDPDKIPLKLDIFRILKTYCERPEGNYPLPQKLVTMAGLPTSSVFKVTNETIEVMSVDEELKTIYWANWAGFPVGGCLIANTWRFTSGRRIFARVFGSDA